jgi:hypothetical protein
LNDGQPVLLLQPQLVSPVHQRVHCLAICAGSQLLILQTAGQMLCRMHIGLRGIPTDPTAGRLLGGTVLEADEVPPLTLLGTTG